jgi:hypothetical protein
MKTDTQILVLGLLASCMFFSAETAKNMCAGMFGLFFLLRWLNK